MLRVKRRARTRANVRSLRTKLKVAPKDTPKATLGRKEIAGLNGDAMETIKKTMIFNDPMPFSFAPYAAMLPRNLKKQIFLWPAFFFGEVRGEDKQ